MGEENIRNKCTKGFTSIVSVLRFFVMDQKYNIVDKIANSLNPRAVIEALYEALRTVETMKANALKVRSGYGERECCDYGYDVENKPPKAFVAEDLEGNKVWCIPCPYLPKEDEIQEFVEIIGRGQEGLECAKIVALRAYSYPITREGGEK